MRGIDEETLLAVRKSLAAEELNTDVIDALISLKVRELNPWLPLEEFLKSGFEGLCWVFTEDSKAIVLEFIGDGFFDVADHFRMYHKTITHVMPIHKPEPPR